MVAGVAAGVGGPAQQKDGSRGYTVSTNNGQTLASTSTTDHCYVHTYVQATRLRSLCTLFHSLWVALLDW